MYLGAFQLDDLATFTANTHTASTGAATDADAAPAYRVFEDETATPLLTGTMTLLDGSNTAGFYSEQITLSAANGFEEGKCYSVYISAVVGGVTGTTSRHFQVRPAPATAAGLSGLNDLSAAEVNAEVDAALADAGVTTTVTGRIDATVSSRLASAAYTTPLDAAGVRSAVGLASANLDTQLADLPTNAELTTALGAADDPVLAAIAALNNLSSGQAQSAAAAALAAYDGPTKAELDSAVAPLATAAGLASLNDLSAAEVRSAVGLASANLDTQLADLPTNAELATALGTSDDATLAAIGGLNNLSAAGVRSAVGLATASLDTQLADLPTVAEFEARTLPAASYFDPAADAVANVTTVGTVTNPVTAGTVSDKSGYALSAGGVTAVQSGLSTLTAQQVWEYVTRELTSAGAGGATPQEVWEYATRTLTDRTGFALTAAYDAAKTAATQTSVNDLPTNAELTTALGAADDPVLAAIAALNNLSSGQAQSAAAAALAAYDGPTKAELDSGLASLNDLSAADVLALTYEGSETFAEFLRLARAALVGKSTGGGTTTPRFRDAADTKDRIVATVDEDGNRTAVTVDGD